LGKEAVFLGGEKVKRKPEIIVRGRDDIEHYKEERDHILISITDPYDTNPKLPKNPCRLDTLKLRFHDWDDKQKYDIQHKYKDSKTAKQMVFSSKKDAKKIVEFVRFYDGVVDAIYCQCAAGISRSAGVAAALAHCLHGYDHEFFERYIPNRRIYRLILGEWYDLPNKAGN
jgi:predicted protein tyrosine phosphatase